jgi:hypothetical protein
MLVAPTSAITSSTISSSSSSDIGSGMKLLEHVELVLFLFGLLLASRVAECLAPRAASCARAQHLQLLVLGQRPLSSSPRRPGGSRGSGAACRGARHRLRASHPRAAS